MAATTEVLIGEAAGPHILVRPLARSQPGLFDDRDGNWIDCEVDVAAGAFHGTFRAAARSEEFRVFLDEVETLDRTLDGAATLTTMEGQLALSLGADDKGSIRVTGAAIDEPGIGNRLQFGFEIDRTSLRELCRSLEHLLASFPVAGGV